MSTFSPKFAVFHDSFCQFGGAERFAEELHGALSRNAPTALHTTVAAEQVLTPQLRGAGIQATWMRHLPLPHKFFRAYFLLFPFAVEHADLREYDLIVSSCFGYAKGVRKRAARHGRPAALHICYCHTPMRWVWRTNDYLAREGHARLKSALLALPLRWLKRWELKAARRPDLFLANSNVVAKRLRDAFGVEATVIPPPIDTARFAPLTGHEYDEPEDFYLVLSRLVPYKRFDLAINACRALKRKLVIIGDGVDRARLESLAAGDPNIVFLGRVPDAGVVEYARRTRGLLFPGEEDFGMTPLEINAAGRPVIAYRAGGATETIIEGLNGLFFDEPTAESLADAMLRFEDRIWDMDAIRMRAAAFDRTVFRRRILQFVEAAIEAHQAVSTQTGPLMFPSRVAEDLAELGRRVGRAS
jgi:glycosyltransferase involved in cell wall biosynthesis